MTRGGRPMYRASAAILPDKSGTNLPTLEGWKAWWAMGAFHVRAAVAPPTTAPHAPLYNCTVKIPLDIFRSVKNTKKCSV